MNPYDRRAFVLVVAGLLCLANPVYLYPEGVSYETRYTFEAEEADRIPRTSQATTEVAWCGDGGESARCVVASDLAEGGSIAHETDPGRTVDEWFWSDDYVRTDAGFFEPTATVENGTLVLGADAVSREAVRRTMSEELDGVPQYVGQAVRNGRATVTDEAVSEPRRFYVRHDGRYYLVEAVESERRPTGWGWKAPSDIGLDAMRLTAWLVGLGLVWRGGAWSERGRRARERARNAETRDERRR